MVQLALAVGVIPAFVAPPPAEDERPIVGATFFYWYVWDYATETGNWAGEGVYNTPLTGYYDSRSYEDNLRSLRTAADWGTTDFFMDYWGPGWQALDGSPRELLLTRATEELRRAGFDIRMSMYQDAADFDMSDFAANIADGRHADWWMRNLATSPAWLRVNGLPFGLIYGRNGLPKPSEDVAAFRSFLLGRYRTVQGLNAAWSTDYAGLDDVTLDTPDSVAAADLVDFRYAEWARRWAELQNAARARYGVPGIALSFDAGFAPYLGMGFTDFVRTFGGTHSYGGVEVPHDFDQQRFIYHAAARYAGRRSFDHHKCYYHDWEIRIPGISWPAEPFRFDRSFVNMLTRYARSTLHMSWNEWWEGSNLEASEEFGKGPCETNLLYSTVMQQCAHSLLHPARDAKVALVLNEWPLAAKSPAASELYETLDALRRLGIPFEAVPGAYVGEADFAPYDLIIVPGGAVGLDRDGATARRLLGLADQGKTVLFSRCPQVRELLGLRYAKAGPSPNRGPMNVFIDVGAPGDERYLLSGYSLPENWGKLPPDAFGAGQDMTMRWTPATGRRCSFYLPASPGRDHVLRLAGSALVAHKAVVEVDGRVAGELRLQEGYHSYEVRIAAGLVRGEPDITLSLVYEKPVIPKLLWPERFSYEERACNLAIDWVQLSTDEFAAGDKTQTIAPAGEMLVPEGPLAGLGLLKIDRPRCDRIEPLGTVLSTYSSDGVPRDMLIPRGTGRVGYVNGSFGDIKAPNYLDLWIRNAAGVETEPIVRGADCAGAALEAGDTTFVPVYNYTVGDERGVEFRVPARGRPVASVRAVRRDGTTPEPVRFRVDGGTARFDDDLRYFGLYEVVRGPLAAEPEALELVPGQRTAWRVSLSNLTDAPVTARVSLESVTPTLASEGSVPVSIAPNGTKTVDVPVQAREDADWGRKTAVLRVVSDGADSRWLVAATMRPLPTVRLASEIVEARSPEIGLTSVANAHLDPSAMTSVTASVDGRTYHLSDIRPGETVTFRPELSVARPDGRDCFAKLPVEVAYKCGGREFSAELEAQLGFEDSPAVPPGALAKVVAYNTSDQADDVRYVACVVDLGGADPATVSVRNAAADVVPSLLETRGGRTVLHAITDIPARWNRCLYICRGPEAAPATDLVVDAAHLDTGHGRVRVENSHYALTLEESAGGCATELRSKQSGKDYAADTFGAEWGTFKVLPKDGTAFGDGRTIKDDMTRQRDGAAHIRIDVGGTGQPICRVTVERDGPVTSRQVYTFVAGQPWFLVSADAAWAGAAAPDEVDVLDFRLARNGLTKVFPNWTGTPAGFEQPNPHCGWRESAHVPEFLTLLERPSPDNPEAWTLGVLRSEGLSRVRAGFWPEHRPEPGPCSFGEVELVADGASGEARADCVVVLHSGHHVAGREAVRSVREPDPVSARRL